MRVPPSLTYSATTPSSRRATSSMNAGGNDHSRPTSKPIFCITPSLPAAADVGPNHIAPIRPVVRPAIPQPERVPDVLAPQHARHMLVVLPVRIIPAGGQNDVLPADRLQMSVI